MLQKNRDIDITCSRLGADMEGVCEYEGMTVFVPGALPGEGLRAKAVMVKPRYAFGRLTELKTRSPEREDPFCPAYEKCGGCSCQHMKYDYSLKWKREQIKNCLMRIAGLEPDDSDVPEVMGAGSPKGSRNKTSLPVGGTAENPVLGFYRRRSHDIIPLEDCPLALHGVSGVISAVTQWMRENHVAPYDEKTRAGVMRHVVARRARSGRLMVLLITKSGELPDVPGLARLLKETEPGFCALHRSVNDSPGNVILGETSVRLWGEDYITETLLGLTFEISPLSFFQVNPAQTERLYSAVADMAGLKKNDICLDAYAGAGTIALIMAGRAERAIGVEIVPQAVQSARRNAKRNGVTNAEFILGAAEQVLPDLARGGLRPDVIILDPPRKGAEEAALEAAAAARPRKIVYVSCHAPTQARDIKLLMERGYRFEACRSVDMFCYASGVENIVSLARVD